MYHPDVIAREQAQLERRLGLKLIRQPPEVSWEVAEHLGKRWKEAQSAGQDLDKFLTPLERQFITNERLLCTLDFHYWCRYAWIMPDASVSDGSGLVRFVPWEAQSLLLDTIARMELAQYDASQRGDPQDGILIMVPKARQEGITMLARILLMHRLTTAPYTLAITATENEDKRLSLWNRDERILSNLPFWLQPERTAPDLQGVRTTFGYLDSWILYQDYQQESSLAAGEQFLVGHMSEVAQGPPYYISAMMTLQYFPAIPQSWRALHLLESTPNGRGDWWHQFAMSAYSGTERWRLQFIPWYAAGFKYRRIAPPGWQPSQIALDHAAKVEETSPEYLGRRVTLTREQLYWWESTREEYRRKGELTFFLTNYPATLEESFQFSGTSVFSYDVIEHYRAQAKLPGGSYEITGGIPAGIVA